MTAETLGGDLGDPKIKRRRIAVINSHPIQYFAPLYAYIQRETDVEIEALYLSDSSLRGARDPGFGQAVSWDIDLLSGYPNRFVGERAKVRVPTNFWSIVAPEVWSAVRSGGYDAILIHGHAYAANLIAMAAAKSAGVPVMVKGEAHLGLHATPFKRAVRHGLMSAFYAGIDRMLAIGSANAAYYRALGVPAEKVFIAPYCVDNDRFAAASALTPAERAAERARLGLDPAAPAILYAAKFTPRKHPQHLLEAVLAVRGRTERPFSLIMGGAGEQEAQLKAFCAAQGLDQVVFPGFVNQAALPRLYGSSDVFVLPSENEPWGLAVNEAMAAGLPVVVSREVGCVADLVQDGVNGFTPEAGDVPALAEALHRLVTDDALRAAQSRASRDRIAHWGYRECAAGIRAALKGLPRRGQAKAGAGV